MKCQKGSHQKIVIKCGEYHIAIKWAVLEFVSIAQTKVHIGMKICDFWGHSLRGSVD